MTPHAHGYLPWTDPQFRLDPYPWYARLRADHPVFEIAPNSFVLTRYRDVMACATHPAMTVKEAWKDAGPWKANVMHAVIGLDPPEHGTMRRFTNQWFGPKAVRDWVETTRAETRRVLDGVGADGIVEGWMDLSVRPTHQTMARVLGITSDGEHEVAHAMEEAMQMLSAVPNPGDVERAAAAFDILGQRIDRALGQLEERPGTGLADALLAASQNGQMTRESARATTILLYALGHMDVGYMVVSGLHQFTRIPGLFRAFRDDPAIRAAIIEEMIRIDPPELSFVRHATEDVNIGGVAMAAGAQIRCMMGAANRDPEIFANPDAFDYARPPEASRNLSFGSGIHNCAGQILARAEMTAIFETIAERYETIDLAGEPEIGHHDFARSYQKLPLKLS